MTLKKLEMTLSELAYMRSVQRTYFEKREDAAQFHALAFIREALAAPGDVLTTRDPIKGLTTGVRHWLLQVNALHFVKTMRFKGSDDDGSFLFGFLRPEETWPREEADRFHRIRSYFLLGEPTEWTAFSADDPQVVKGGEIERVVLFIPTTPIPEDKKEEEGPADAEENLFVTNEWYWSPLWSDYVQIKSYIKSYDGKGLYEVVCLSSNPTLIRHLHPDHIRLGCGACVRAKASLPGIGVQRSVSSGSTIFPCQDCAFFSGAKVEHNLQAREFALSYLRTTGTRVLALKEFRIGLVFEKARELFYQHK